MHQNARLPGRRESSGAATEAAREPRGILIAPLMLASDYGLFNFIQKVAEICRGKVNFTTAHTLGRYLRMDYMQKRVKQIH